MMQKNLEKEKIKEIKIEKKKILDRADETIKSAKEIKTVLGQHNDQKSKIEELKSEICINTEQFSKLKKQIQTLEHSEQSASQSNKEIKELNSKLKEENLQLKNRKIPNPNEDLKNKITRLIDQKNQILEENLLLREKDVLKIKITSKNGKEFCLFADSVLGGTHTFTKEQDFSEEQINIFCALSKEIDQTCEGRDPEKLFKMYEAKIVEIVNPKISNIEYRKLRPSYRFLP